MKKKSRQVQNTRMDLPTKAGGPKKESSSGVRTTRSKPKANFKSKSAFKASPRAKPRAAAVPQPIDAPERFPIVGIGASAGGLEALEQFLRNVPDSSGMAFVIVQHLDPMHKGSMVELLQRITRMQVLQVEDRVIVATDRVYVIPPGKNISILRGRLHLLAQQQPRGVNLPVDFFFRSLAEDQQERSIGVILSGMGSDGTLGLRAIKEKGGAGFVQALASAKFDGMPSSAIDAGLADIVAPAEELPARIVGYRRHAPYIALRSAEPFEEKAQGALEKIFILLRSQTGNDFSLYKKSTIHRRIARRMGLHQIDKIAQYVRYLVDNPREVDLLFRELLIGVTSFFRDLPAWEFFQHEVLPTLLTSRPSGSVVRAWVPGCSTGEEAYSLAIAFKEALESLRQPKKLILQVFATDLDRDAIEKARVGAYPANIAADVSPERLRRFFLEEDRGYRVSKDIREMVVFAPQNIVGDPPFTRLDILSCRNLLIYLAPELQRKLIPLFHYALNPGGALFLGSAETIGMYTGLFAPTDGKTRVYRKLDTAAAPGLIEFPATFSAKPAQNDDAVSSKSAVTAATAPNLQRLAEEVLIQRFAPTAILTTDKGDILYINGRTGKYLEPASGRANMNLFAMARDGLRLDLSTAFSAALREDRAITVRGATVGTNGGAQLVNLTVQRISEPKDLRGSVMVVITDTAEGTLEQPKRVGSRRASSARTTHLELELQRAHEEVQTTREEMQTSQEELKSTNEELQSTNEELQSTNEELTTSKEEMQSMNEELQTVNHELQSKVDELSRSNNDMKNLLNSTDIATLFLDGDLLVRRFTSPTANIIKLIPTDVGRPITDIARSIDYPELVDDAHEVIRTLVYKERVVTGSNHRWFAVRIMPYRTLVNVIDGVVITFTDATGQKALEGELRRQSSELTQMADSMPDLLLGCRADGVCDYVSSQWVEYTGAPTAELLGHDWFHVLHEEDRDLARQQWRAGIKSQVQIDLQFRLRNKSGDYRWFKCRAMPIRDPQGKLVKWYATSSDIEDTKQAAVRLQQATEGFTRLLERSNDPYLSLTARGAIAYVNAAGEAWLGRARDELLDRDLFAMVPPDTSTVLREALARAEEREQPIDVEVNSVQGPIRKYNVHIVPGVDHTGLLFRGPTPTSSRMENPPT